ncbi:MAG: hypothetical protein D6765_05925 [Bacteroidetes bacterium]|nr:MAG: hypothetical protein D6765_05925 [Bacteroidota bacterium]
MKKLLMFIGLCLPTLSFGQYLEAGLLLGGANYLGDLSNNSSRLYLKETRAAFGAFGRYNLNDFINFRLGANIAWIGGEDANVDNDESIRQRNLSFRSRILEGSLTVEWNILGYQPYALARTLSPYLFGGIAVTNFNPKARYQGRWVELQPLGTEGQGMEQFPDRKPYRLTELSVPFGVGVKYALTDKWNLGFEIGARRSFTDYLDDVSTTYVEYGELLAGNGELAAALGNRTGELSGGEPVSVPTGTPRGDDNPADWYFIAGFTVSYNFLDNGLMGSRRRLRSKAGCRVN